LMDFKNHFEWKELIADAKSDVHMWHRSSERGLACLKSTGHLDFTPRQIWLTLVGGPEYKSQYDKNIAESTRLEKIAPNTYTMY